MKVVVLHNQLLNFFSTFFILFPLTGYSKSHHAHSQKISLVKSRKEQVSVSRQDLVSVTRDFSP